MSEQDPPVPPQDTGIAEGFYPLSFGHRFAWTWRFARTAFWYALGLQLLFVIAFGAVAITTILAFGGFTLLAQQHQGALVDPQVLMAAMGPTSMAVVLVAMLVGLLLTAWYQAAFSRLPILYLQQGRLPRYRNLLWEAWSRTPDMASAMGLIMLLPLLLAGVVYSVLVTTHRFTPLVGGATGILLVIVLLTIFIALALTGPVVANEPVSPVRGLQRAWWLSRGRRGSIFGFVLLVSLLYTVLLFAINLVGLLLGIGIGQPGLAGLLFQVVFGILGIALQVLYMTALQTGLSVYYLEARVVSEGWTPNWKWSLHPYWPNDGTRPLPIGLRGKKGWIDLLLINAVALGALWGAVHYLGETLPIKGQWSINTRQHFGTHKPPVSPGMTPKPIPVAPIAENRNPSDVVRTAPTPPVHEPTTPYREPAAVQEKPDERFDLSSRTGRDRLRHWLYQQVSAGHCQASMPWLDSLLAKVPNDAWVHYARAACLQAMGQQKASNDDAVFACGHGYIKACDLIQ